MYPRERSLVKRLAGQPFALVGVNSDEDREALEKVLVEEEITWRSFWNGPLGTRGPLAAAWNVTGWPTVYVLDHEGIIRAKGHALDEELVERLVEEAAR